MGRSSVKWVSISSSLHGQAWAWKQCVSFISRLFSIFRSSDYMPKLKKESLSRAGAIGKLCAIGLRVAINGDREVLRFLQARKKKQEAEGSSSGATHVSTDAASVASAQPHGLVSPPPRTKALAPATMERQKLNTECMQLIALNCGKFLAVRGEQLILGPQTLLPPDSQSKWQSSKPGERVLRALQRQTESKMRKQRLELLKPACEVFPSALTRHDNDTTSVNFKGMGFKDIGALTVHGEQHRAELEARLMVDSEANTGGVPTLYFIENRLSFRDAYRPNADIVVQYDSKCTPMLHCRKHDLVQLLDSCPLYNIVHKFNVQNKGVTPLLHTIQECGEDIAPHAEVLRNMGATVGCSLQLYSACARRLSTRGGTDLNSLLCTCALDDSACRVRDKKRRLKQ